MKYTYYFLFLSLQIIFSNNTFSQTLIQGKIFDEVNGQSLIGVRIFFDDPNSMIGTISDINGFFELDIDSPPPVHVTISFVGYQDQKISVEEEESFIEVYLIPSDQEIKVQSRSSESEVVTASKIAESKLSSSISIEKMGVRDIQLLPTRDFYAGIGYLKSAFVNTSSFSYHSINTRGFANLQNWRFISLIDGMDISGPGVNYGVGNVMKGSELDIREIELVPGPGSALYGPNALNGLVAMSTKSPFSYQGVSAYVKQGMINRPNGGTKPYTDIGVRYANNIGDRFAFKINATYLKAHDWISDDRSHLITNPIIPFKEDFLTKPASDPNFDAVNIYGDDIQIPVDLGDEEPVLINRSGIAERDLLDYEIDNLFLQASLHYRITNNLEASYDIRYSQADNIIRYENFYPFENFSTLYQKLEVKGTHFLTRVYLARDNSGDGYSVLAAGAIIQEALKPSTTWGSEYGAAYRGEVSGIGANDHIAAREYADRDLLDPDSRIFQEAKSVTTSIPISQPGGSGVSMKAQFLHADIFYDFANIIKPIDIQIGGSFRRYVLDSEGHVYSDGPLGFDQPIPVWEYGLFSQFAKSFLDDRLNLRGSIRYDRNKNFTGKITPRASIVGLLGSRKKHAIRASWQTGFRNPANQDTYVAFNAGPLLYLGNIEDNINNFSVQSPDGVLISGTELYNSLVTTSSFQRFLENGGTDPNLLDPANLSFLQQEQITTLELGYRATLGDAWIADASYFHNTYQNFTANIVSFSTLINLPILTLNNVPDKVFSQGINVGMEYQASQGLLGGGSYNYIRFDAADAMEKNPFYFPDFNTPEHSYKLYIGYQPEHKPLGFITHYRWFDDYTFQSPNGQGSISSFDIWDAAIIYRIPSIKSQIKVGATNILGNGYQTVYGGPLIGGEYYVQWTFDELVR